MIYVEINQFMGKNINICDASVQNYTNQYTCHKLRKIVFFILMFRDNKITCELVNPFKMAYKNLSIMENFLVVYRFVISNLNPL